MMNPWCPDCGELWDAYHDETERCPWEPLDETDEDRGRR